MLRNAPAGEVIITNCTWLIKPRYTIVKNLSIEAIYIKNYLVGDVLDVIMCAKFQNEIFRGYDFTGGPIFHFHIDF